MSAEDPPEGMAGELIPVLEAVHAQQSKIHGLLATLESRTHDLEATVGEAVHRAFMAAAGVRAAETLVRIHRAQAVHFARWVFGVVSLCALVPAVLTWILLPSPAQIRQSRQTLQQLDYVIAVRSAQGGRMSLRRCGHAQRLCAQVDRKAPFYGDNADYMILKGY